MAERRMLSKKIFQSRKFLMMPFEAQALYTHLILSSDDDGVVEAFPIVRMIGAKEDSLGLLVVKKFILPLNDDMVYFITDFEEQNKIRADRVQPSRYRELLLEKTDMVVDGKRVTGQKKYIDGQVTDKCLTNDGQVTDKCPHSIGKDRIVEDSIGEYSLVESRSDNDDDAGQKSFSKIIKDSNIKINERHTQMLMDYIALDHFTIPMIQYAVEKTEDAGSTSFNYLKAILENWKKEGFTSLEEVEEHDRKRLVKQTKKEASPYPIKNPVFSPYTDLLPWEEDEEG
ncbi:MAG: DnaD domain protein [Streptococcus sp.]|uniref:DnaD domain-containing protein n=1 Tax=Streptococcus sp. TaxID=1306 RepID=UPI00205BF9B2|nr:DnaD domain protein [Streptococcus sp.]MDU4508782.1 DnaD domain protein [Streptococcus sp.]DAW54523.1 MAG TPA: replisome organizer protein [Caudoviricetes sp.]